MKKIQILGFLLSGFFLLSLIYAGCNYAPTKRRAAVGGFDVENYDSALRPHVYHYDSHPRRIVALWQNSIETLLMLGAGDRIVAAGGLSTPEVLAEANVVPYEKIPIRTRQVPDVETMLMLQPDLIVGWLFDFVKQSNGVGRSDFWERRGTNIYMTTMNGADYSARHTLEDELRFIRDLGMITGCQVKAAELEQAILAEFPGKNISRSPRVLVISSAARQLSIYTPRTLSGDLLRRLGATVLGAEQQRIGEDEFISYEQLLLMDPDVIFLQSSAPGDQEPRERLYRHPALQNLRAVKEQRVFCVPFYLMRCPGVRVLDSIRQFKSGLELS